MAGKKPTGNSKFESKGVGPKTFRQSGKMDREQEIEVGLVGGQAMEVPKGLNYNFWT